MAEIVNNSWNLFTWSSIKRRAKYSSVFVTSKMVARPFVCLLTDNKQRVEVKNGKDSLDICRVINGTWQTSGGWGRIDRDNAVEAMLRYADAGLDTFDLADICKPSYLTVISIISRVIAFKSIITYVMMIK